MKKSIQIKKNVLEAIKDLYTLSVYITLCSLAENGSLKMGTKELAKASMMGVTKFKKSKKILSETIVDGKPLIEVYPLVHADGSRGHDTIVIL